jgi:3-oxoacyl-[acyl-carrier protein] reductase
MDLGIRGRRAIVCASSRGLGRACAEALAREGVHATLNERGFGRIVNITLAMVKTPLAPMGLSTGARAGLTSLCKALSRQVASANVTLNNLLPERIDTERQRGMAELRAKLGRTSRSTAAATPA